MPIGAIPVLLGHRNHVAVDEQQAAALRARALAEVERRNDPTYRGGRDVVVGACPRCGVPGDTRDTRVSMPLS
ncbi:hypothetical protein MSM1_20360 [Mycobacterium sp. SM1]|uniref:hypothetical protein n=1 Tax=Mycobacterium sp. SM1 TaxID=2816243 RepID=UPI001BCC6AD8|nr:hypothetical protein [Mycobacterium sp. SM1]MBS4730571.1 hypothetical protein [Mycobacterium sp. SM1]